MKYFFTIITIGFILISCKESKTEAKIKVDSTRIENTPEPIEKDLLSVYELFSNNKEEVESKLKSSSTEKANELYDTYYKENNLLLSKIIEKEITVLDRFYSDNPADKKVIKTLGDHLNKYGLEFIELGEGYVEIETKSDFYFKIFGPYVTTDYKDYLSLINKENETTYQADAGLIITFAALGDRIIYWENFINKYPKSSLQPQVQENLKNYRLDYLLGLDNTPTRERTENLANSFIYPENIDEFDRFQKKYPNSPTNKLIKIFRENYKSENVHDILNAELDK